MLLFIVSRVIFSVLIMGVVMEVLLFVIAAVPTVQAYIQCGAYDCYGWESYCCGTFEDECCDYSVYQYWWFWLIWLGAFLLIVSCSCWCYRKRQYSRAQHYVAIRSEYPPSYGTIVVTSPPAYPAEQHQIGPTAPPKYTPQAEKPPEYTP